MNFDTLTQTQLYAFAAFLAAALEFVYGLYMLRNADPMAKVVARLVLWMGASALAAGVILYFVSDQSVAITAALASAVIILAIAVLRARPEMKALRERKQ